MRGTVKTLQSDRKFGFIAGDDRTDRFFHITGMATAGAFDALSVGSAVEFEHEDGPKGPRATNVRPVHG